MTKALRKGIRTRSRLRNSHFEKTKILPIGITAITTKFLYWSTTKGLASSNIVLKEKGGDLITDNQKLVNLFITYFTNNTDILFNVSLSLCLSLCLSLSLFERLDESKVLALHSKTDITIWYHSFTREFYKCIMHLNF